MKKLLTILITFNLAPFYLNAQQGWFWQNPLPQGHNLVDVKFINATTGWAVGFHGTVIKTTNSGEDWDIQSVDAEKILYSVNFIDENTGWVGGIVPGEYQDSGIIKKTTDGGMNWIVQSGANFPLIYSIHFADQDTGWAVGGDYEGQWYGKIMKTINGGSNWVTKFSTTGGSFYCWFTSVYFIDNHTGWVVGLYGKIFKTTDGGENWTPQTSGTNEHLYSTYFITQSIGWAVGNNGTIVKTTDGGENWLLKTSGTTYTLNSVFFNDQNIGWAVGTGTIFKTNDGGNNWITYLTGLNDLWSVYFAESNLGWTVGYSGTIIKLPEGTYQSTEIFGYFNSVDFVNQNTGWAVGYDLDGDGVIFKTTDGGTQWTSQSNGTSCILSSVCFVDEYTGWAAGGDDSTGAIILKTIDGGINWTTQMSDTGYTLHTVQFIDNNTGWAAGNTIPFWTREGVILKTTDGGINWISQLIGLPSCAYNLGKFYFIDQKIGWATAVILYSYWEIYGEILKTTDGGDNWQICWGPGNPIGSPFFVDHSVGWVIGTGGTILKTTDGGENWINQNVGATVSSIYFTDQNNGWIAGWGGMIRKTTDGGDNWVPQTSLTGYPLYLVHFVNENTGWALGGGVILKTTTGGVTFIDEEKIDKIPNDCLLSQNFPNPFNPSTKFRYSVNSTQKVIIIVYDLLGREIATLVNEEKPAGSYEVIWNAENLPSGVYFYHLRAGSFVETKKMILLK